MSTETPHDSLFRYAFSQPGVAEDHFRATLPPAVVAAVRWDTLVLVPGSFVDEELKQVHSDVLYRAELDIGPPISLYVLFEHQSTPDPRMAWRLLRYMVRIWDRVNEDGDLPCIVPMVLYNGDRAWNVSLDFHGLFVDSLPSPLWDGLPQFRYELLDLSSTDDAELQGVALRRLVLLLLKHARERDFWDRLPAWLDTLETVVAEPADGLRSLEAVLRYVTSVTPREIPDDVRALLVARLPAEGGRVVMSWGQILEERGREQGLREGRLEGRLEGRALTLLAQIRAKFGLPTEAVRDGVRNASEDELDRWTERILTADDLDALFR